jgi:hypothetical protein
MSDATDINSLPINPASGDNNTLPNIVMSKNEMIDNKLEHLSQSRQQDLRNMNQGTSNMQNEAISNSLDQTIINKLISGIQQASINGLTSLPSSHIQLDTNSLTHDPQIKPNYIPSNNNSDYIKNENANNDIIKEHMRKQNKQDTLDVMYDELQIPVLIAILYFAFQLPIVRKYLFSFFPSLFNKDGNPKLYGYVFNSLMFALIFYIIKKLLNYLTNI